MARQKTGQENVRKLSRVGGITYTMSLPLGIVQELGWQDHQRIHVRKDGDRIILEDWKEE